MDSICADGGFWITSAPLAQRQLAYMLCGIESAGGNGSECRDSVHCWVTDYLSIVLGPPWALRSAGFEASPRREQADANSCRA